jgi:SAM-dependent methyltransferase
VPRNWNEHYAQAAAADEAPAALLADVAELTPPGRALDLACGAGRNALYLASLGWKVVAVDSSTEALRILRQRAGQTGCSIDAQIADLETGEFSIEPDSYDLICDFYYLDRRLFSKIREGVRPGGLVAAEIHLREASSHRFVLDPGELRREFADWKIVYYSEALRPGHRRPSARLLARRA